MAQKQPGKKFAGALAKILSAGQKETEMAGFLNGTKLLTPQKTLINWVLCRFSPGGCSGWHRRCQTGVAWFSQTQVQLHD